MKLILSASQDFTSLMAQLLADYEARLKWVAHNNPETQTNIKVAEQSQPYGLPLGVGTNVFFDSAIRIQRPKNNVKRLTTYRRRTVAAHKASIRHLEKLLNVKGPITQHKIISLMSALNVPVDAFVSAKVDHLTRKYLTKKEEEFMQTFKKTFFSSTPPFHLHNKVAVTWGNDLKGLLTTTMDDKGMMVKKPTERLIAVMKYYNNVIDVAYRDLDTVVPGQSPEVVCINRVKTYNTFASLVNNVSPNLTFNASSLLFTYMSRVTPYIPFERATGTLSDIRYCTQDVEVAYLRSLIDPYLTLADGRTLDEAVKDPYNVLSIGGFAYDQLRPALRCEYVLLKVLFYFAAEFRGEVDTFVKNTYGTRYQKVAAGEPFAVNNVLQLCPGLMTIMFYGINKVADVEGQRLLEDFNVHCKTLTDTKGYAGKQAAIEIHKKMSTTMEKIAIRFIDLIVTETIHKIHFVEYANLLFLRSGMIKGATLPYTFQ